MEKETGNILFPSDQTVVRKLVYNSRYKNTTSEVDELAVVLHSHVFPFPLFSPIFCAMNCSLGYICLLQPHPIPSFNRS